MEIRESKWMTAKAIDWFSWNSENSFHIIIITIVLHKHIDFSLWQTDSILYVVQNVISDGQE